jgi:hypothetical protein
MIPVRSAIIGPPGRWKERKIDGVVQQALQLWKIRELLGNSRRRSLKNRNCKDAGCHCRLVQQCVLRLGSGDGAYGPILPSNYGRDGLAYQSSGGTNTSGTVWFDDVEMHDSGPAFTVETY